MKKLILTGLILISLIGIAHAETEVSLSYARGCKHLFHDSDYNEQNNHIFMLSINDWFGMTFRNSYGDRTIAAGYIFRTPKWYPLDNPLFIRGNLPVGLMHGYHNQTIDIFGVSPATIPAIEIGWKKISFNTTVFPVTTSLITITF